MTRKYSTGKLLKTSLRVFWEDFGMVLVISSFLIAGGIVGVVVGGGSPGGFFAGAALGAMVMVLLAAGVHIINTTLKKARSRMDTQGDWEQE